MEHIKFNIYGFARPTTRAERSALLDEALRLIEELDGQIEAIDAAIASQSEPA